MFDLALCRYAYGRQVFVGDRPAVKWTVSRDTRKAAPPETPEQQAGRLALQFLLNVRTCEIEPLSRLWVDPRTGETQEHTDWTICPDGYQWRSDAYLVPSQLTWEDRLGVRRPAPDLHPALPDEGPYTVVEDENGLSCSCRCATESGQARLCAHKVAVGLPALLYTDLDPAYLPTEPVDLALETYAGFRTEEPPLLQPTILAALVGAGPSAQAEVVRFCAALRQQQATEAQRAAAIAAAEQASADQRARAAALFADDPPPAEQVVQAAAKAYAELYG